jgi:hypothetical protein
MQPTPESKPDKTFVCGEESKEQDGCVDLIGCRDLEILDRFLTWLGLLRMFPTRTARPGVFTCGAFLPFFGLFLGW